MFVPFVTCLAILLKLLTETKFYEMDCNKTTEMQD